MVIGIEATHAARGQRTGVEEYCYRLIQEFKTIIPSDVRVILYSKEPLTGPLAELPGNWENRVLSWPFKKGWSQVRLAVELWRRPPDIFFAPGQLVPVYCPKRTITTIHDCAFKAVPEAYNFFSRWYLKIMNRLIFNRSSRLITTSQFNIRELSRLYPQLALPPTTAISLGYNQELFVPLADQPFQTKDILERHGIAGPFFISIGRLETKKNTARIVEAFTLFKQRHGTDPAVAAVKLVLVGSPGAGYQQVAAAVAKSPCPADILQLGYVDSADLPILLAAATAFVFPSLYEGFGIPVLEAMAMCCPVIVSTTGALPEIVGGAGMLVNPTDTAALSEAYTRLMSDMAFRLHLCHAGSDRVRAFSWRHTAEQTWQELLRP